MSTNSSIFKKFKLRFILLPLILILLLVVFVPGAQASDEASSGFWHHVRYGETLSGIAYHYGTTVHAIARANGIVNPNWIYAGMRLWIPVYGPGGPGTGGYCSYYHTVTYGDTLSRIARWYGRSLWSIAEANNIYNTNLIYRGQVLCIP